MIDEVRRRVSLISSGAVRAAAAPARGLARLGRAPDDPRWASVSWLWQPGWGRLRHRRLYRAPDPYGTAADPYEQQKFDRIMEQVEGRQYVRVLEVGCGEGALCTRLVSVTDDLLGVDISPDAVRRATARVPSASFESRLLPQQMPEGTFDLVVASDVLYYWENSTLRSGVRRLFDRLSPDGLLVAYHYRGHFGQANSADVVHEVLREKGRPIVEKRFDGVGPSGSGARLDVLGKR